MDNNLNKSNKKTRGVDVKWLVGISMFAALAYAVGFATSWLKVAHLTFDAKDAIITLAAFIYGPVSAVSISFVTALIESLTLTFAVTFWHGFLMDFVSSATFALTATLIYKKIKSFNGAIISFAVATLVTTAIMLGLNILVTPLYTAQIGFPMTAGDVVKQIPTLLLPFNFAKALMNSAIAMVLYKPISQSMKKAGLLKGEFNTRFNRKSVYLLIISAIAAIAAIVLFIITKSMN